MAEYPKDEPNTKEEAARAPAFMVKESFDLLASVLNFLAAFFGLLVAWFSWLERKSRVAGEKRDYMRWAKNDPHNVHYKKKKKKNR